jgi:uncharacterized protein involved in outer membrane biogenesis
VSDWKSKIPSKSQRELWGRRIRKWIYILLGIAVAFRIILFFALYPVLAKVAEAYGFSATYDRQELTLLGGDVGLWGLRITPSTGGEPVFSADYLRGNISTLALLEGRLWVRRAEVDGCEIVLERTADGHIPLLEHLVSSTPAPTPSTIPTGPLSLYFNPSLTVEAFRLQHVRTRILDERVQPTFDATVATDVRVSDFGIRGVPTNFEIDTWSDPALDLLRIVGQSRANGQNLTAYATVTMRGLHPKTLAGYLTPLGIRAVGSNLTASLYATLDVHPAVSPDVGMSLAVSVQNIGLWSDEQPAISVGDFSFSADAVDPQHILLNTLALDAVRLHVTRDVDLGAQFGGFTLCPPTQSAPATQPTAPSVAAPSTSASSLPFGFDLRDLSLTDIDLGFRDTAVYPVNELHLTIPTLGLKFDPSQSIAPITGSIAIPGILQTINFSGQADAAAKNLIVKVRADGIRPDGLKPYLTAGGIESLWTDGKLAADFSADLRRDDQGDPVLDAACGPVNIGEGTNLLSMKSVAIRGVGIESKTGRVKIESVELSGPYLHIDRDSSGRVTVANFRYTPPAYSTPPAASSAPSGASPLLALSPPRIDIGRFLWHEPRIEFHDEFAQPASDITLTDAGIDIKDFQFDLDTDQPAKDGKILGWLKWPAPIGDGGELTATGSTHSQRDQFHADLAVRGANLHLAQLAPFTRTVGFEPTIQNGTFTLDAATDVARQSGRVAGSLAIQNVSFRDGPSELVGMDALHVDGIHLDRGGLDIDDVAIQYPRISAGRDADGIFRVAGIRVYPSPSTDDSAPSLEFPQPIGLTSLKITAATLNLTDLATPTPLTTAIRTSVEMQGMDRDPSAPAATFAIHTKIDGILPDSAILGSFDPHPEHPNLAAQVTATGLRGDMLNAYLPPGTICTVKDGRFHVAMEAQAPLNPAGGRSVQINIHDLDWRDGPNSQPMLTMAAAKLIASRVDPAGGVIAIDEVSLHGVKSEAQLDASGNLHAMGITLGPAASRPPAPPKAVSTTSPAISPRNTAPANLAQLISRPNRPVPHMTLQTLDIDLDRFAVRNLADPTSKPLAIENVRLWNPKPLDMGGATPFSTPLLVQLTGAISPIVGNFTVNFTGTPLQAQPTFTADLSVSGIRGQGITEVAPSLSTWIDGSGMTNGQITATAKAVLNFNRRGPADFNLARGFSADLSIRNIEMRDRPGGSLLAGVKGIYAQSILVRPAANTIAAKTVDIVTPQAYIYRDPTGIHVCGITLTSAATPPPPPPPIPPGVKTVGPKTPAPKPAAPAKTVAADPPSDPPPPPASGEARIDRLTVSGLDVRVEDRVAKPTFVLPLNGLDLEIKGLTTRALTEQKWIRFSALLSADQVPIPPSGKSTTRAPDLRPLFTQAAAAGRIALYPRLDGFVKLSLNGLELAALQSVAQEFGVNLTGGLFDSEIDLRPRAGGTIDTYCRLVLTDLQISEPANGPISQTLGLPAPLDTVIGALQAPDGSITVAVSFPLQNGQITKMNIEESALQATGPLIATAIASAPLKLAGGVIGVFGIGGPSKKPPVTETYDVTFAPGSTDIDPDGAALLRAILILAHRNPQLQMTVRQELGAQDVALASQRANPTPPDALAMIHQLQQRRLTLTADRARLAGLLRGQLAALSDAQSDPTVDQLRQTERQLADTEQACDQLYELLRPGADRQAGRRTRGAAMEIAQARLDNVDDLFRFGLQSFTKRVRTIAAQFNPTPAETGRVRITLVYTK